MENNRLVSVIFLFSKIYLVVVSLWFVLAMVSSYFWYVDDGAITNFCIPVSVQSGDHYDFRVSEHNACLIDWMPFLQEALFMPFLIYMIFSFPALLIWFLCRYKLKKSSVIS